MSRFRQIGRIAALGLASVSGAVFVCSNMRNTVLAKPVDYFENDRDFRTRLAMMFRPSFSQWDDNWDMCETTSRSKKKSKLTEDNVDNEPDIKPTAKRHLVFIRHAQYKDNEELDEKRILTELGRIQADITGQRLKDLNKPFTKIIVSDLVRAKETAEIIFKHLPDVPRESCSLLREGAPIPPEPPSSNWRPEQKFFQDSARIEAAFRKHVHRADTMQSGDTIEIYICHANVIRYFICRALQFPPEGWLRMSIGHCGITTMTIRPNGRISLRSMGDTGHLPPEKITF
ncbi:serine/threonine-protein phosphatase PGAM5, mitochondrial isoform X2 [Exaiptasia diaphana]|uniref:Serine/threonine-protein phosphatase PGAM5, mitochondrial n=1 Tax=Exaiptasia diaphana TaxID=2652724 RepID=A0A913WV45_EXADI|nr:serine/threonine-protein phosphatase PGAM5, mitochondrial isoform X2 [Exaiptasia diaphana]